MKTKLKLLAALLAAAFVTDCAHKIEDNLNKKLAEQPDISGPQSLADQASKLIQTSPNLTELQRSKLSKLRDETQQKIKDIDQLSLKLRSTLYADLVSPSFNRKEVDLIKNRIKKVEKKKVSVLLNAVESASAILGREAPASEKRLDDFYYNLSRDPGFMMRN